LYLRHNDKKLAARLVVGVNYRMMLNRINKAAEKAELGDLLLIYQESIR
jgi:hypothetical protein